MAQASLRKNNAPGQNGGAVVVLGLLSAHRQPDAHGTYAPCRRGGPEGPGRGQGHRELRGRRGQWHGRLESGRGRRGPPRRRRLHSSRSSRRCASASCRATVVTEAGSVATDSREDYVDREIRERMVQDSDTTAAHGHSVEAEVDTSGAHRQSSYVQGEISTSSSARLPRPSPRAACS